MAVQSTLLTLVSQPFTQLHILRTSTEGQEVAPHIERGVLLLKEVLGGIGVICREVIDCQAVGQRRRVRHGALRILGGLCRTLGRVVPVVTSPAKPLATGVKEWVSRGKYSLKERQQCD